MSVRAPIDGRRRGQRANRHAASLSPNYTHLESDERLLRSQIISEIVGRRARKTEKIKKRGVGAERVGLPVPSLM